MTMEKLRRNFRSVTGADVAGWMGKAGDQALIAQANAVVPQVTEAAYAYTRGQGFDFDSSMMQPEIATVVMSVSARVLTNPSGLRISETTGPYSRDVAGWQGFTLFEQVGLNRWRKKAL